MTQALAQEQYTTSRFAVLLTQCMLGGSGGLIGSKTRTTDYSPRLGFGEV